MYSISMRNENKNYEFDVALSFAGEDREYVDSVANALLDEGVKVFYDEFEEVNLWGKDLYTYLSDIYMNKARYTVMFISKHYSEKLWTNHERKSAQARAFQEAQEYILPARFDDTEIPGVLPTVGYISANKKTPQEVSAIIIKKLVVAGFSVPTEIIRKNYSSITQSPRVKPTVLNVEVRDDQGTILSGISVTALADNGTVLECVSNNGVASIAVQTRRKYRVLVAHENFPCALTDSIDPAESVSVVLQRSENIGSIIVHGTGHIKGLKGRLNPILDTSNRTYLYADNIAINSGKPQPVSFDLNVPFELEDCDGNIFIATVKLILGRTALIQYIKPNYGEVS